MGFQFSSIVDLLNRIIHSSGYELKPVDPLCEGYDRYADLAVKENMDVNDYIEEKLGWGRTLPMLEKLVFPYIQEDSCVCELGPGTGRQTRYVIPKLTRGTLHLFDHSPWMRNYLKKYLSENTNLIIHGNNGRSIDLPENSVDLCFSLGMFVELKLGEFLLYAHEFQRILKKGAMLFSIISILIDQRVGIS